MPRPDQGSARGTGQGRTSGRKSQLLIAPLIASSAMFGGCVSPLEQSAAVRRSSHRFSFSGIVLQDCLTLVPAKDERIELLAKRSGRVLATTTTNDAGEFTLRGPYIDTDELEFDLLIGPVKLPLGGDDPNSNYFGNLAVPCRSGGSVGRWDVEAGTSTQSSARTGEPTTPSSQRPIR